MNLRDLEYFIKLAEHRHFGKAAKASHVSQPTLSAQLKKLEDELSIPLFERSNKEVRLTLQGAELLPLAKKISEDIKNFKSLAKHYRDPFAGELKIGVIPTIAPYFLPKVLKKIQKALPKLKLLLVEEKTDVLLDKLEAGDIDIALLALPIAPHAFHEVNLFAEPFYFAAPKGHSLSGNAHLTLNDLRKETMLLLAEGHCLREHALAVCERIASTGTDYTASSLETLCQMVALGYGVTLLPEFAARQHSELAIVPFKKPVPARKIGLLWRKTDSRLLLFEKLAALLHP